MIKNKVSSKYTSIKSVVTKWFASKYMDIYKWLAYNFRNQNIVACIK